MPTTAPRRRPSLLLRFATAVVRSRGVKTVLSSPERTEADRLDNVAAGPARPPARLLRELDVQERTLEGVTTYRVAGRGAPSRGVMVYLPGGAYINPMVPEQWGVVRDLVRRAGMTVHVPMYRLAPEGTVSTEAPRVAAILRAVVEQDGGDGVVAIGGDSAGGGLAAAVSLHAGRHGGPRVDQLVLFSPWLDVALTNPGIAAIDPHDPSLAVPGLRWAGRLWAGDVPLDDPLVSPVHADPTAFPPTTIVMGSSDIFAADARQLVAAAAASGADMEYLEAAGGFHVFVGATFLPETRWAMREVAARLRGAARG
ncbi:alpha/beta hydrolase [Cellulomonas iranensis]|uniref:alpha/beta hydrolase n=1 Tax=Cellulomonas iranensis TaxID=76862 RepID=UPI000B3BFAED|nr:alpha/beta hydrolase [Cellulomonas iranensis]